MIGLRGSDERQRSRELRARCRRRVEALHWTVPFDLDQLRSSIERERGRPLVVTTLPGVGVDGVCGTWVSTDLVDVVAVSESAGGLHRQHILLHEFGHLLSGHRPLHAPDAALAARLFPDVELGTVRSMLSRDTCDDLQEQEAELFALLVQSRIAREQRHGQPRVIGPVESVVRGLRGR